MNGYGVLRRNGFIKYEGEFVNGMIEGFGKMMWQNDVINIGKFKKGI